MNKIRISLSVLCLTFFLHGCVTDFTDSGYFAEIPSEYLVNEKGQYIDEKGNVTDKPVRNPYYDAYKKKWGNSTN